MGEQQPPGVNVRRLQLGEQTARGAVRRRERNEARAILKSVDNLPGCAYTALSAPPPVAREFITA